MNDSARWSRGYPVGEPYPVSWHGFQSPAWLRAICAITGVAWNVDDSTPLSICEVGCGVGYTANVLAAANPLWQVVGLDYNPAHIAEARQLAETGGLDNARFLEADLAELSAAELATLPEFDLVMVHGVWSWVDDTVREGVLRLLRARLKPGGLALVTYNALPGAAGSMGLARLVRPYLQRNPDSEAAVAEVGTFLKRLLDAKTAHLARSGWLALLTGERTGARSSYLRHEFETAHWRPAFFADVAAALASARCAYAGTASVDENFPGLSLDPPQQALWNEAPDQETRELIFDHCVARAFRRDLYVRGLRRVNRTAATEAVWVALASLAEGEVVLNTQAGEARMPQALIDAVRAQLRDGPATIGTLKALPACAKATAEELLAMLLGARVAVPLWRPPQPADTGATTRERLRRFHRASAGRFAPFGVGSGQLGLVAPSLGGALPCSPLELAVRTVLDQLAGNTGDALAHGVTADAVIRQLLPVGATPDAAVLDGLREEVGSILTDKVPVWRSLNA